VPGSLDFTGMLAALEGRRPPAPRHPLDELAEAGIAAGGGLRAFDPEPVRALPRTPSERRRGR